jgi:O-antigen/teichoic acid export membrane protein
MAVPAQTATGIQDAASSRTFESARPLARAALGSLGLSVANTATTTVLSIVLARIMGVSDYGIYAVVVAAVTLLGLPAVMGVDRLLIRDIAIYAQRSANGLIGGLLVRAGQLTLFLSVSIAIAAAFVAWLLAGAQADPGTVAFAVGAAALPFFAVGRVAQGGLMGFHHVALGQLPELLLRPVLLLIFVAAAWLAVGGSASAAALNAPLVVGLQTISVAIAALVGIGLLWSRTPAAVRTSKPEFRSRTWLFGAIALALLSSAAVINSQTGVMMLGLLGTPTDAGLYAIAQRGALLVAFPLAAVNVAIGPTAARLWAARDRGSLQRLVTLSTRGLLLGSLPIALAFILFGKQLLTWLFGAGFGDASEALTILCIGQLANAATGSVAVLLVMTGHQVRATLAMAAGATANIAVAALLIPGYGVNGAAIAAALSLLVSNLVMVVMTRRTIGIDSTAIGRFPAAAPARADDRPNDR